SAAVKVKIRSDGALIDGVDAGEVADLAAARLCVESLRIPVLADLKGSIDEDLQEGTTGEALAHHGPVGREGGYETAQHDQAGIDHELGDFRDATQVFDAVAFGEAEVAIEPQADIVAVEQDRQLAPRMQPALDGVCYRR